MLGTAALLGVLFASVQMVLPSGGEEPVSAFRFDAPRTGSVA